MTMTGRDADSYFADMRAKMREKESKDNSSNRVVGSTTGSSTGLTTRGMSSTGMSSTGLTANSRLIDTTAGSSLLVSKGASGSSSLTGGSTNHSLGGRTTHSIGTMRGNSTTNALTNRSNNPITGLSTTAALEERMRKLTTSNGSTHHTVVNTVVSSTGTTKIDRTGSTTTKMIASGNTRTNNSVSLSASTTLNYRRKPFGFKNLGNTCFMNCILQCLISVPQLVIYLRDHFKESDLNVVNSSGQGTGGKLVTEFRAFIKQCINSTMNSTMMNDSSIHNIEEFNQEVFSPKNLRAIVVEFAPQFSGYNQHDAHELLRFLLDGLHEDLNRVRGKVKYSEIKDRPGESMDSAAKRWWDYSLSTGDSPIYDIFAGQLLSETHCGACGHNSWAFDVFLDLSLPIPTSTKKNNFLTTRDITLTDCFRAFVERENLDVDDYKCENCKKTKRITKRMGIYKPPKVLVIHLKRFAQNSRFSRSKLDTMVCFPITNLDIGEFVEASPSMGYGISRAGSSHGCRPERKTSLDNGSKGQQPLSSIVANPFEYSIRESAAEGANHSRLPSLNDEYVVPEDRPQQHSSSTTVGNLMSGSAEQPGTSVHGKRFIYDLFGVAQHSGSMGGGHYTACVKLDENSFSNISDSHCSSINIDRIADESAYVLFYVKRTGAK